MCFVPWARFYLPVVEGRGAATKDLDLFGGLLVDSLEVGDLFGENFEVVFFSGHSGTEDSGEFRIGLVGTVQVRD